MWFVTSLWEKGVCVPEPGLNEALIKEVEGKCKELQQLKEDIEACRS